MRPSLCSYTASFPAISSQHLSSPDLVLWVYVCGSVFPLENVSFARPVTVSISGA